MAGRGNEGEIRKEGEMRWRRQGGREIWKERVREAGERGNERTDGKEKVGIREGGYKRRWV